jgi:hypothetical protein
MMRSRLTLPAPWLSSSLGSRPALSDELSLGCCWQMPGPAAYFPTPNNKQRQAMEKQARLEARKRVSSGPNRPAKCERLSAHYGAAVCGVDTLIADDAWPGHPNLSGGAYFARQIQEAATSTRQASHMLQSANLVGGGPSSSAAATAALGPDQALPAEMSSYVPQSH